MISESEKIKPKTDFEPFLNYSDLFFWEDLKKDPGAGANADCRVDKTFSGTDPLSEIVWSPDKGFSLKCVDSSFTNENTSIFEDVGPSSMVLALLQSVTGGSSTTDKPTDNLYVEPTAVLCTKRDVSSTDTPAQTSDSVFINPDHKTCQDHHITGPGENEEKMNTAGGTHNGQEENLMTDGENNICALGNIGTAITSEIKGNKSSTISGQVDEKLVSNLLIQADEPKSSMEKNPSPMKHGNGGMDSSVVNQVVETEDGLCTRAGQKIEYKGSGSLGKNLVPSAISPQQQLKSTVVNDLQTLYHEATNTVLVSRSNESENKSQVNEMVDPGNKNLSVMHSPCDSRIQETRNEGKLKSLLNEDSDVSLLKEENDHHLSFESYHTTGLFLTGKKRRNFHQVVTERKKAKTQIQETSCSRSYVKPDSSFLNLISNMMKGCSQSNQDEGKSLALTLENPDHLKRPDKKFPTCNDNQDPELKSAGIGSNFQHECFPRSKNVGTREASKYFEPSRKVHGIDATPITFYAGNNSVYRQQLLSNKLEVSRGRHDHDACPPLQSKTKPINSFINHDHWKNNTVENENCYNLELSEEKMGMTWFSLHSSSTRQSKGNNENVEPYTLYEREKMSHRSDTMGGLWINRFSPKSTSPLIVFDHLNKRGTSEVNSMYCSTLQHSNKHISLNNSKIEEAREEYADDQLLSEAKRLHDCCINDEASTGLEDVNSNHNHTSKHNFNSITHFPGLRDSGPMVSMFARRVGAIKECLLTE